MAESPSIKTISNFKSVLKGGGARPNLFEVQIPEFPAYVTKDAETLKDLTFLCEAAQLPASNVAPIDVPFRGRTLKVAGDRTFETWTITIINDEDFKIRHAMEMWMNGIAKLENYTGATNPTTYMRDAYVYQLGRGGKGKETTDAVPNAGSGKVGAGTKGNVLRSYRFYDVFPTNISAIDLAYDTTDTIEEFTVELQVQYFEIGAGPGTLA